MEGPHSPFGSLWQIVSATGWSMHYILWEVDYLALRLMLVDQPRYAPSQNKKDENEVGADGHPIAVDDDDEDEIAQLEAQYKALGY
jgi:hypothetical protein